MSNNSEPNVITHDRERVSDPQQVVMGTLKNGERSDVIVFKIPLSMFEIVCIVTIPEEGTKSAPVYVKFRVNR
jgi:hypothetical protein